MIEIKNLNKIYNPKDISRKVALDNISFEVKKGEIISIIGRTGSGKSTISNILLGLTKPTDGEVKLNDEILINRKTKNKSLRGITKILLASFQFPDHQLFMTNVRDEILFNNDDKEKEMEEMLKIFDFDKSLLEKSPYKLSSGQKRKVILMSLILQKPKVLVLDEATAFLDARTRAEFVEIIKEINTKYKTTIIFISHNLEDVKKLSTKSLLLEDGKQIMFDKTDKVLKKYLEGGANGHK